MTKRKTPGPIGPRQAREDGEVSEATTSPPPAARELPARKPMLRAARMTLFEREVRERLSRAALDVMFARAESISEGQRQTRSGREMYFGSTMMTFDLAALDDVLRDVSQPGTPARLVALMQSDGDVASRIRELTLREATRIAVTRLRDVKTHVSIRAQETKVFVDVDVEATV